MKKRVLMIALPISLFLLAFYPTSKVAKEDPKKEVRSEVSAMPQGCAAPTSHTFSYPGGSGNCNRTAVLFWYGASGASSYNVRIMYHGGTGCPGIPSGVWINYNNVQSGLFLTMPRCFSLDLEITSNCSKGGTSAPYLSGFTYCWP